MKINVTLRLIALVCITGSFTLGTFALSAPPSASAQVASAQVERLLNPDGTVNLNTGFSGALDLRGWNVTLDSVRGPILTHDASASAAPNAGTWSAFANTGLNSTVYALAVSGSDLYVGGEFTQTADGTKTLNHIAKYSGGAWSPLANNGLENWVWALAVSGSDLYVGGSFSKTADGTVNLNYIAKYNTGTNTWSALAHNGLDATVQVIAVSGSDLYVGGSFGGTADGTVTNLSRIAKYDTTGSGAWSAFAHNGLGGFGVYSVVSAFAVVGSDLYVGGYFTQTADGAVTNLNDIAKYSGGAWYPLANNGLNEWVGAFAVIGSDLYVGGIFYRTADSAVNLNYIAKYNTGTNTWSALANNGLGWRVRALAVSGSDLYVGGDFVQTKDGTVTNLNHIAKYSSGAWYPLANGLNGSGVYALAMSGSDLYVGGNFTQTADGMVGNLNCIAKYGYNLYLPLVTK